MGTVSLLDKCEASKISVSVGNSANLCSILHGTYKVTINLVTLYPGGAKVKIYTVSTFTARIELPLLSKYVVNFYYVLFQLIFLNYKNITPVLSTD